MTLEDANALIWKEPRKRYTFDAWDEMFNKPNATVQAKLFFRGPVYFMGGAAFVSICI